MSRIGWGILGCGSIATHAIAPAITWSQNGRLVAVASRDRGVAEGKRTQLGALRAYAPYEALLEDREVDAVYIGLPNGMHEEWALRAAAAGKHVLCEKSLTLSADAATRMGDAFAERGLRLVEAFMYRHHPQWRAVKELLPEIGEIRFVRSSLLGHLRAPDDHRWSASLGGGALFDVTCYPVNAARFVLNAEPIAIQAVASMHREGGVDETTQASLVFPDGVIASVSGALDAGRDQSFVVVGTAGTLEVTRPFVPGWSATSIVLRDRDARERHVEVGGANHFLHQVEHFVSLVLDPARKARPSENGVANVGVCEAIARSFATGRRFTRAGSSWTAGPL
jgi:predicted dehydrogenase